MPDYAPGTPSWVELSSPDPEASATFYRELMGWSATEPGPVEETGGYRMFQQDGQSVGGLMGHMEQGQPTTWATYVSVADADETADKVKAAGGDVVVEPMDVMDIGRMAYFTDPTGAVFGVWQPKSFAGRPRQRAQLAVLERGADPGRRDRQGLLPSRLRLGCWTSVVRRRARELPFGSSTAIRSAA